MSLYFLLVVVLQSALIFGAALLLERLLVPRAPKLIFAYWQLVLILLLVLPFAQIANRPREAPEIARPFTIAVLALGNTTRTTHPYHRTLLCIVDAGIAARLLWLGAGLLQLRRIRLSGQPAELAGGRSRIFLSSRVTVPASYGFLRHYVILPAHWHDLDAATRQAALTHELIHLRRHDWRAHLLEELLLAVFWFNPAMYGAIARVRFARELVVDRETIRLTGEKKNYLLALVALAAPHPRSIPAPCFSAAHQLKRRVEIIQRESTMSQKRAVTVLLSGSVFLAAIAVVAVTALPLRSASAASDGDRVYKAGGAVVAPKLVHKVDPGYTAEAKDAKIGGAVVLSIVISKDGVPRDVQVVRGLDPGLDRKAIEALQQWRFQPGTLKGQPVAVRATIEIQFKVI